MSFRNIDSTNESSKDDHVCVPSNITIKEEVDNIQEEDACSTQVKCEVSQYEISTDTEIDIKEEIDNLLVQKLRDTQSNFPLKNDNSVVERKIIQETQIKIEMQLEETTPCDYLDYDVGSMDSNEATALGNVETCLQEDLEIKIENSMSDRKPIKKESTITETHLIANKIISTTATVTNAQDGLRESHITNTLVMEITPMLHSGNSQLSKIDNDEEILPTQACDPSSDHYDDAFQLNSITGDCLSLEQEAYGLLKAKKKGKIISDKEFICPLCPKSYLTQRSLKRHMEVHDSIDRRKAGIAKSLKTKAENRACKVTEDEEYEQKINIKNESSNDEKKNYYKCTCSRSYKRRTTMESCMKSHDEYTDVNIYSCITCSKEFKDKESLMLHRKRLHSRKKFPCKFCPTDYNTRKELFKHLRIHQKFQLLEFKVMSEVVEGKQKLKCFICSKTFTELTELKTHAMEKHKEPYKCHYCKKSLKSVPEFVNHIKTMHPDKEWLSLLDVLEAFSKLVRAWKCEECNLQFYDADKLALHQVEQHHPDLLVDSQVKCLDCRRLFLNQKGLTSHRRVHHSTESVEETVEEIKGALCLECRKICKDMNALTLHMRLHSPERKYPCKFCDFRFATPEKRKTHSEIHTGDMKYVCFICEYQCTSENRLKQHKMSIKHLNMKEYLLTGKPLIEEEPSPKPKKKESKAKKRKKEKSESLSDDASSSNEDHVTCDICGENFTCKELMLEHKQTHPFIEFPNEDTPSRIFFK